MASSTGRRNTLAKSLCRRLEVLRFVRVISLAVADALRVSTSKSDRLPWPLPAKPEPAIKPAEPVDYAQADAEAAKKVRRAHAEAPDLCQRHGVHKAWTKDGRSWRCQR